MAKITLTCPQDGLVASEVGIWAKEKHDYLRRYIQISSKARVKYIPDKNSPEKYTAGATYIDLFCGSGRSKIKDSNEWIDGSAIVAWKTSQQSGAPFSQIYIADSDEQNLLACKTRLEALGAVVVARHGTALDALSEYCDALSPHGLHFSFIDPFNLKSLDFTILESLSNLKRIDMLIHLSKMDLQRNLVKNLRHYESDFDAFVPGWRDEFDINQGMKHVRQQVIDFWIEKVKALGVSASKDTDWKLITGKKKQPLYWLMLIAKHDLAHKFWNAAAAAKQDALF
jgi:three-Cys-motif partner protein